jgi:hypothetical protein
LLPAVCLALAVLGVDLWRWAMDRGRHTWLRAATPVLAAGLALSIGAPGLLAYQHSLDQAAHVSQYAGVGEQIQHLLPTGGYVLGPERWWWPLRDHPYLSLRSLWWQWLSAPTTGVQVPTFTDGQPWQHADSIVVNDNVRDDLRDFPPAVQARFWAFIAACTTPVGEVDDATYFDIQIYQVTMRADSPPPGCESASA